MKKTLALILALLTLSSVLISCGADPGDAQTTTAGTSASEGEVTEVTETGKKDIKDTLPEYDMNGGTFTVLVGETFQKWLMSHEMNGEVINDAMVESTSVVEERFNVKLEPYLFPATTNAYQTECRNWALAGENVYDLATLHDLSAAQLSIEGLLVNIYEIPYLDFEMPWWQQNLIDIMTFMDQMYIFTNSMDLYSLVSTRVYFFNKGLIDSYGVEDPYTTVANGDWTLDYVIGTTKDIYDDVNGNAQRDDADVYGFVYSNSFYGYQEAFGIEAFKKTDEGLELDINNERTVTLVEKHYDWLHGSMGGRQVVGATDKVNDKCTLFSGDKAMIVLAKLGDAIDYFRHSEVDYGIVPVPKFDENQDEYTCATTTRPYFVPITNPDLERTGIIIEALSAESYKNNFDAVYEVALKDKFLYDEQSVELLDMIYSNTILSFSYMYDTEQSGFAHTLSKMINSKTPTKDFASYYASRENAAKARVEDIVEFFEEHSY